MSILVQEVRHALRTWCRTPVVAAVAILSLSVAIGANTALFSALDAIGLRPLAVSHEEELVRIAFDREGETGEELAYGEYLDVRDQTTSFSQIAAWQLRGVSVSGEEVAPTVSATMVVTGNYLPMLGLRPVAGRLISPGDDRPGAPATAMIGESYWRRRYGADPHAVGRTILLNRIQCTIVGVVPDSFKGTRAFITPDVWLPVHTWPQLGGEVPDPARRSDRDRAYNLLARLRPGVGIERARNDVTALAWQLRKDHPEARVGQHPLVESEVEARTGKLVKLRVLALIVVGLVLLVASANVAGLLLGRADARRSEIAIRLAIGASRLRIVRQLLIESALLAVGGCLGGIILGRWVIAAIPSLLPPSSIPISLDLRLDARVLWFTLTVGALAVPLFGLVPALVAVRRTMSAALRGEASVERRAHRYSLRDALVVGQICVSVVLLVGAVLVVRALVSARNVQPGFERRPALLVTLAPGINGYTDEQSRAYYDRLVERTSALPQVRGVTLARRMPLSPSGGGAMENVVVPGHDAGTGRPPAKVVYNTVGANFFATLGTRLLRGRDFRLSDAGDRRVVVISEEMARQGWPKGDAIGQHLLAGSGAAARDYEVVGVVQNVMWNSLDEAPRPAIYFYTGQRSFGEMTLIVRTSGDEAAVLPALRAVLKELDPTMPTMQILTMDQHMRFALAGEEAVGVFGGTLGLAGLLLASVGLYAVISFFVSRRSREIGIRLALGATPARVMRGVLGRALELTLAGTVLGLAGGVAAARGLSSSLYGIGRPDATSLLLCALLVALVTGAASLVPARAASRTDPARTLRTS